MTLLSDFDDSDDGNSSGDDGSDDNLPNWPFYNSQCNTTHDSSLYLH